MALINVPTSNDGVPVSEGSIPEEKPTLPAMNYMGGLSYAQIGRQLGLSVSNVGFRLHHVLKAMGQSLRRAGLGGRQG